MLGVYKKVSVSEEFDTSEGALPFSLQHIAEKELGETPSRRKDAIQKLLQILSDEPELNSRKDDEFLLRFLRVRKYNVDAAMQTIRNYYKIRTACGPIYSDFLPSKVPSAARTLCMVMPEKDVHGRPIVFMNIAQWIPSELPFSEYQKAWTICMEYIASDPVAQVLGVVLLLDFNEYTIDKILCVRIGLLKKAVEYLQDCMPMRLKAMHIVNQSYAFDMLYMLVRPVMKSKLIERFHLYGKSYDRLHEEIPSSVLPEEYGGQGPPLDYEAFWRRVDAEEELFAANNQFGYTRSTGDDNFPTDTEIFEELTFM
ncbi:alpha-tocopherol transfer protein-like [Dermacentor silvarum]|uniref:alpha-tocopherol transfer protein-like n=1 Tax=Dermacentor silvarum TaxID=543639 RepID=UPI00189743E7|nr:alpha-tocopherol transfer protein-like [Dermacentor silvarum]